MTGVHATEKLWLSQTVHGQATLEPEPDHRLALVGMLKDTKVTFLCLAQQTSQKKLAAAYRRQKRGRQGVRELSQVAS